MSEGERAWSGRQQRDLERALAGSAGLLEEIFDRVEPPSPSDDFLVCELAGLLEKGEPSFDDKDFLYLIEQGIRLEYDPDISLRAQFVEQLRLASGSLPGEARRVARHLVGAIEDADFPMHRIAAVVRHYVRGLFERVDRTVAMPPDESLGDAVGRWRHGQLGREGLIPELERATPGSVPTLAELLLEGAGDPEVAGAAIGRLAGLGSPAAVRTLAYAVAEPLLEEAEEARALEALHALWPGARTYILYRLRQHTHEDIPYRWMELLIDTGELRAVDRILEEVLRHARDASYREDLLMSLDLVGRSADPGRAGKVFRLLTEPRAPDLVRRLLGEWVANSLSAEFLGDVRRAAGGLQADFVHLGADFSAFAASLPDASLKEVFERWNGAYHESLGWQQRSMFPRSDLERRLEEEVEGEMLRRFPPARGPEEAALREQVESFREDRLRTPRNGVIPLVAICRERPRHSPWLLDAYLREINGLYVRAAECYDEGDRSRARRELDLLLEIEPEYPLARMLDRVMSGRPEGGDNQ